MSRAGKLIRLLVHDKAKVDRFIALYIHHRNLYGKGESEISFVRRIASFQSLMITWLFLRNLFPAIPTWIILVAIPVLIVSRTLANWFVGYLWDSRRLFDKETDWNNDRNPAIKFIQQTLTNKE
jgi:hypothetical protein